MRLSRVLAGWLLEQKDFDLAHPLRVVELGSGTGICAAALALAAKSRALPCEVLATDLSQAVPLLHDTMKRNKLEGVMRAAALDWYVALAEAASQRDLAACLVDASGQDEGEEVDETTMVPSASWAELASADLVLAADVTFSEKHRGPLLQLLAQVCSKGAVALIAHEDRDDRVDCEAALASALGTAVDWIELEFPVVEGPEDVVTFLLTAAAGREKLRPGGPLAGLVPVGWAANGGVAKEGGSPAAVAAAPPSLR